MKETVNVVAGAPIYRAGAYILDKFLANQKEIQQNYPSSELVLATVEGDYVEELERLLSSWGLRGKVLRYETVKPDYARSGVWNVACGREAIRQHVLSKPEARYMLSLDVDMTYDPSMIEIMEREIQGYDVAYGGYAGRTVGMVNGGLGCTMFTKEALERIKFRCYEFKNGDVLDEGVTLEMDLIRLRQRFKRGFFLSIAHYENETEAKCTDPHPLGLFHKITNFPPIRYTLIRASIVVRRDITGRLHRLLYG